jgi:thiol-disulfide isomerase/thioredoxin
MKKALKAIAVICICLALYSVGNLYVNGSEIPIFKYKNFYTNVESSTKLPSKKTIILFFTAECGSCDDAARSIFDFSKANKDFNFVFVTEETDKNRITNYLERNNISKISDYIYIDQKRSFQKDFGLGFTMSIPTILYYDENGKFIKEVKNLNELFLSL